MRVLYLVPQAKQPDRLSAYTFLTPLFGVFAGYTVMGDPITPGFAAAYQVMGRMARLAWDAIA